MLKTFVVTKIIKILKKNNQMKLKTFNQINEKKINIQSFLYFNN